MRDAIVTAAEAEDCASVSEEDLTGIESLPLSNGGLTALKAGDFAGLRGLQKLVLSHNGLRELPAGVFSGLSSLRELDLSNNALTTWPPGVFAEVPSLTHLFLQNNQLKALPDGVFVGFSSLEELNLEGNPGAPFPLTMSLERTDGSSEAPAVGDEVRVVVPTGAPFDLELELGVQLIESPVVGGELAPQPGVTEVPVTVTVPAGGVSGAFTVPRVRVPGRLAVVGLVLKTLRTLVAKNKHKVAEKVVDEVAESILQEEIDCFLTHRAVCFAFRRTFLFQDTVDICDRTRQVQEAIIAGMSFAVHCSHVPRTALLGVGRLDLRGVGLTTLKAGDFADLLLFDLNLANNQLRTLPAEVFAGLSSLWSLNLGSNQLGTLPAKVFDGLSLRSLGLDSNNLTSLPPGIFAGLSLLETLHLERNSLEALQPGVFALLSLETLHLEENQLASLLPGTFAGLSSLKTLRLGRNQLEALQPGVFAPLLSLEGLGLEENQLASLPPGVFAGHLSLTQLYLFNNQLMTLRRGVFADLSALQVLDLSCNPFTELPADIFTGLSESVEVRNRGCNGSAENEQPLPIAQPSIAFTLETTTINERLPRGGRFGLPVTLNAPSSSQVTVTYETVDNTAIAGKDYEAVRGTLTFAPGETSKSISLRIINDKDAEDDEQFIVTLTDPINATLGSPNAVVVTVQDDDEATSTQQRVKRVNAAVMPLLGRTLANSAVSGIVDRLGDMQLTAPPTQLLPDVVALGRQMEDLSDGTLTLDQLLSGLKFRLPLAAADAPLGSVQPVLWGSGAFRRLSGDDADAVDWRGTSVTYRVGVDVRFRPEWVAGVAVSWAKGDVDYTDRTGDEPSTGTHASQLTSVHPYVSWQVPNGDIWATAGYGRGTLELEDEIGGQHSSGLNVVTGAVGGSRRLLTRDGVLAGGETALRLKGEGMASRIKVQGGEQVEAQTVHVQRLRLLVEGSHVQQLGAGRVLRPSVEVGWRQDGGDGPTGAGLEVGGGLRYQDPALGLTVEARARALAAHEASIEDWGAGGSIRLDPGRLGLGPSFRLVPSWGQAGSGAQAVWDRQWTETRGVGSGSAPAGRLDAELGYGMVVLAGRGVGTPRIGLALDAGSRTWRMGYRLGLAQSPLGALAVDLDGTRREAVRGGRAPVYSIRLNLNLKW